MGALIFKNYTKNPSADAMRDILGICYDLSSKNQDIKISVLAHRYLLSQPVKGTVINPDIKSFVGTIALLQYQGILAFDRAGVATEDDSQKVTVKFIASLARKIILEELEELEIDFKITSSQIKHAGTVS